MATEFSWDSFTAKDIEGVAKDAKSNGADQKRRHDDMPRYNAPTDGSRKPRGQPFHNRNNNGAARTSETKHDTRIENGNNNNNNNGNHNNNNRNNNNNNNNNAGRGGEQFNRQPTQQQQRKPRTASDSYEGPADRPKSQPPKGQNQNRQFRNSNAPQHQINNNNDAKNNNNQHRGGPQQAGKPVDHQSHSNNTEKELRQQIMRMKGHMLYLKDQNAYKDQVIHHKDQVILALRAKLEKLKAGSSENAGPSTSPVEPEKPHDLDKMEQDLAGNSEEAKEEVVASTEQNGNGHSEVVDEDKKVELEEGEIKPSEEESESKLVEEESKKTTEEEAAVEKKESEEQDKPSETSEEEKPKVGEEASTEN